MPTQHSSQHEKQLVWDVPTRLFHWALVLLLGFSWWSAKSDHMQWHRYSGIVVSGLMMFRIIWGVIGSSTARFEQFVKGPRTVWRYVRADEHGAEIKPGHNPLGGWSVVALLLLVSVQFVSGLFAIDIDGLEEGPLSYLVAFDQGRIASRIHHTAFNLLLAMVVVHVVAVVFYLVIKRRNLIHAMFTGFDSSSANNATSSAVLASRWRFIAAASFAAVFAYVVANGLQL